MKKLIAFAIFLSWIIGSSAQTPNTFKYQAVVRDNAGQVVVNKTVGFRISILQTSATGAVVFSETHSAQTNAFGLVNLEIGAGTIGSGAFSGIDWGSDSYFVKIELDDNNDGLFAEMGTSQLLSVPYALYAKTAETVTGTVNGTFIETDPVYGASVASGIIANDTVNWNDKQDQLTAGNGISIVENSISATVDFYLGQDTLDGIVFYIYLDQNGEQHGLIVAKTEIGAVWQRTGVLTNATRSWDGVYNMNLMSDSPAKSLIIANFPAGWYIPSIDELSLIWHNRFHVNKALNDAGATLFSNIGIYWSSTEYDTNYAFKFSFYYGRASYEAKRQHYSVRAIRAF